MNWFFILALCGILVTCGPGPTPPPAPVIAVQAPLPPPEPAREPPKPAPKPDVPRDVHSDAALAQRSIDKAWTDTVHYQMRLKREILKKDQD